jgi:hypothetical protein
VEIFKILVSFFFYERCTYISKRIGFQNVKNMKNCDVSNNFKSKFLWFHVFIEDINQYTLYKKGILNIDIVLMDKFTEKKTRLIWWFTSFHLHTCSNLTDYPNLLIQLNVQRISRLDGVLYKLLFAKNLAI